MDNHDFDFKKQVKQKIGDEIKPLLLAHGFVSLPSTSFVRERSGLLQFLSFKLTTVGLRPWAYVVPLFMPCHIVSYGTDNSAVNTHFLRQNGWTNPYKGFSSVFIREYVDKIKQQIDYQQNALPQFDALIAALKNGILPEMERINSLALFIDCLQSNGFIFGKQSNTWEKAYLIDIAQQSGLARLDNLHKLNEGLGTLVAKEFASFITNAIHGNITPLQADIKYDEYCNLVRKKFKLLK